MINKTVGVIGVGGLGGFVTEYLGRMGFSKIVLVDPDKFNDSNIDRQLLCKKSTIGTFKVDNYTSHLKDICDAEVVAYKEFFTEENANIIDQCDIVFDCLDNINARLLLERKCTEKNKVLIHGSIGHTSGHAALVMPGSGIINKIYHGKGGEPVNTFSCVVSAIASCQVAIAMKYINNDIDDILDCFFYIDLEDLEVKKVRI